MYAYVTHVHITSTCTLVKIIFKQQDLKYECILETK